MRLDTESADNFDIRQLRSEINAQTEAYVEFSNALLRIFEMQSEIKADIERLSTADASQVRELFEKLATLSELVRVYTETQKESNQNVSTEMEEYNAVLSHFGSELELFKQKIEQILSEGVKTDTTNREAVEKLIKDLETKLDAQIKNVTALKASLESIAKKVDVIVGHFEELKKAQTGWREWKKRLGWVAGTIAVLWALLQGLVQVGIMEQPRFFPTQQAAQSQKP